MKRLIDLNSGSLFEDTRGMVGSAPYKLGEQRRQVLIFFCLLYFPVPFFMTLDSDQEQQRQSATYSIVRGSSLIPSIIDHYVKRKKRSWLTTSYDLEVDVVFT
jgi:hypothetical protein